MASDDDFDERWTALDDEHLTIEQIGLRHPLTTAMAFVAGLRGEVETPGGLASLVTPESRAHWGNFDAARELYASIEHPGFGSRVNRPEGAPDVGYFKILAGVEEAWETSTPTPVMAAAVITLVWRPEAGEEFPSGPGVWLVHGIGEPLKPEELAHVRTSPGDAPDF